ncbi:MAG TPA: glutathione S-transferase family protein [Sphingobium sp.]|nr:glutathione S-transferase family protein [Sphingobium sp.]
MAQHDDAAIEVTGFAWVPPFARGQVRDLRVRWALEEIGLDYRTRLLDRRDGRTDDDPGQPFGQVPVYREGGLTLFECGAIALHIAEKDERLLPREPIPRARAIAWLFAALNSIDPMMGALLEIDLFSGGAQWGVLRRPAAAVRLEGRLAQLGAALGAQDWLEERFTVGDLMMVATLRNLKPGQLFMPQNLMDYIARGEARPAFQAALAAQLGDFALDREGVPT